ncbi:Hypothetical protein FKW44_014845 [Caligus rogercresseyi]|uniref:Uncharacterized protein n=1 Tax=Caligus rogercresseyi TaxID=217165 RepID=A0A7T8K0R0_CALRO|nr:Hypothetical protein FKW44_014845 [Caligus rogercresseyi]
MGDVVPETPLAISSSHPKETDEVYDFGGVSIKGRTDTFASHAVSVWNNFESLRSARTLAAAGT